MVYVYSSRDGEGEGGKIRGACWPVNLTKTQSSRFNEETLFQKIRQSPIEEDTRSQLLASIHPHMSWGHFLYKQTKEVRVGSFLTRKFCSITCSLSNDPRTTSEACLHSHCCSCLCVYCYDIACETWGSRAQGYWEAGAGHLLSITPNSTPRQTSDPSQSRAAPLSDQILPASLLSSLMSPWIFPGLLHIYSPTRMAVSVLSQQPAHHSMASVPTSHPHGVLRP